MTKREASGDRSLARADGAAAHAEAEELSEISSKGKTTLAELIAKLTPVIEAWEEEALEVARAVDGFVRSEGVAQLGAVLGELRAKLGGNSKAAYAYRSRGVLAVAGEWRRRKRSAKRSERYLGWRRA